MPGEFSVFDPASLLTSQQLRAEREKAAAQEGEKYRLLNPKAPETPQSIEEADERRYVREGILKSNVREQQRDQIQEQSLAENLGASSIGMTGPNEGLEFEGAEDDLAAAQMERFRIQDSDAAFLQPEFGVDPAGDSGDSFKTVRNVANFMFSDEMGLLGIKWDDEGASWAWQNFQTQIQEHPYTTALTLASYMVPIGAAWMKGARVAKRGAELAEATGDVGAATIRGLWGTKGGADVAKMGGTLQAMKALGPGVRFDDHAKLVKQLAFSPEASDGRTFFSPARLERLKHAATDEDIANIVPEKDLRKMLINDMHTERYLKLKAAAMAGEQLSPMRQAELKLWDTFGNTYGQKLGQPDVMDIESMDKFAEKMQLGKWLSSAPVGLSKVQNDAIYKFWAGKSNVDELVDEVGEETTVWASGLATEWAELFSAQADEGFIDARTMKMFNEEFGGFHLPAVDVDTPGFGDLTVSQLTMAGASPAQAASARAAGRSGGVRAVAPLDPAKVLSPPTMRHRGERTTWATVENEMDNLITEPRALTVGGFIRDNTLFQIHRGFRDLITEGVKQNPKVAGMLTDADAWEGMSKSSRKYWMNVEDMEKIAPGLGSRMRSMVELALEKENLPIPAKLPLIRRDIAEQFFGKENSAKQGASTFGKIFEILTGVHKTSGTALNIPTHMSNLMGNFMFLGMAGVNPFSKQMLNDGKMFTSAFAQLAKETVGGARNFDEILNLEDLARIFGKNRFIVDDLGDKIDLAEMFSTPAMRQLIEAQSFESTEGLMHTKKLLGQMEALETSSFGDKAVETVARTLAGVGEAPGVRPTLNVLSSMYLGEDMVPKMMYAAHLARKGWGTDAIVREVGRRMPQYKTVGSLQQSARKIVLPWITFPAEAARIIKNNMMDTPVSMMAWMKAPQIAQSITSVSGMGPDFSEIDALIENAPGWAQRYQTVMVDEGSAGPMLGAVGGAATGGMIGAALGGARGAAAGAAVGGAAGMALGKTSPAHKRYSQHDHAEGARAWSMDFLPTSSIMFGSTHPHEWEKVDPFNQTPVSGTETFGTMKDLSPVEPFAIGMTILEVMTGRGSFGREITSKSAMQGADKMALGLAGFLMPPSIQKYGMRLNGPGGFSDMTDIFEANGGQSTLPKGVTATMFGLSMAGLTALGGKRLQGAQVAAKAGLTAKTMLSAGIAGTGGAMAGAELNNRRLMTDLGIVKDAYTNEPGDHTMDFFFNTFMGVNKSWRSSSASGAANVERRDRRFTESRKTTLKGFMDALRNGSESRAISFLGEAKKSFLLQYADAEVANQKFIAWQERQLRNVARTPQMQGVSIEDLVLRINAYKDVVRESSSKVHRQNLSFLESELTMRKMEKVKALKLVAD